MRVAIMTAGSRGDVAPYTGLGHALARAGHGVTLVTHARFEPLARDAGISFHPLPVDPRAELESDAGRRLHRRRTGVGKLAQIVALARAAIAEMTDDLLAAAGEADVLLLAQSVAPLGRVIAEGLRLPSMGVFLQPQAPTREFAPPLVASRSFGAFGNRWAGRAVNAAIDSVFTETVRTVRRRLGPAAGRGRSATAEPWPVLHGFSPRVVPRPRDWRDDLTVCGYWWPHTPAGAQLPPRLQEFLAAGPPPVFVGLGSATVPDPGATTAAFVGALRAAGLRGVLQRGWAGLDADGSLAGDDMLTVDEVPHELLFPRTAAVVHHAGAGTTGAVLRSGVPSVPVPVQFDAGFWSARLVALGVAPRALPLRRLQAAPLAEALRRATQDPALRARAARLGEQVRAEDGAAPVVAVLKERQDVQER